MSDEPTRRIPEVPPREVPPRQHIPPDVPPEDLPPRERVVLPEDEDPRLLADRLRSLRTAVALLSVLSLVALGVGLWALLDDDVEDRQDRRGASTERVADLEDRVDALRDDVRDAPSKDDVSELRSSQEELEARVDEVSQDAGDDQPADTSDDQAREGVEQLSTEIEEMQATIEEHDQRIRELEASRQE